MKNSYVLVILASLIAGCDSGLNKPRSVEYFDAHPEERAAVLAKCDAEPALYLSKAACQHADQSRSRDGRRLHGSEAKGYTGS